MFCKSSNHSIFRQRYRGTSKKLKDAALYWCGAAGAGEEETEDDLRALGMMPDAIAELQSRKQSKTFEVWEENWDIVMMFLRMTTQWNTSYGGVTGLNYSSLEWLCKLYAAKEPVAIFEGVQVMGLTALSALNSKSQ